MDYSLNSHRKHYDISPKDVEISLITGFTGIPYALRHLKCARRVNSHALGHRLIACLEMIPLIGGLAAIIECIVQMVKSRFENPVPRYTRIRHSDRIVSEILLLTIRTFINRNAVLKVENPLDHKEGNAKELNRDERKLIYRMCQWQFLDEIPEEFHDDPELSKNKSALSGRPIRNPVGPKINNRFIARYERKELLKWMEDHPEEKPPQWPESLPFIRPNIMTDLLLKKKIEDRLKKYAIFISKQLNKSK